MGLRDRPWRAARPHRTTQARKASSTATPMPTRAAVGNARARDEALYGPRNSQGEHRAQDEHDGAAGLLGERSRAGPVARAYQRPAQPQPCPSGQDDRAELEQAVRRYQAPELPGVVGGVEHAGGGAEICPVHEKGDEGEQTEGDAAGERLEDTTTLLV